MFEFEYLVFALLLSASVCSAQSFHRLSQVLSRDSAFKQHRSQRPDSCLRGGDRLANTPTLYVANQRRNDEVALRRKGRTHLRPGAILSLSQRTATVPLLLRRGESEA